MKTNRKQRLAKLAIKSDTGFEARVQYNSNHPIIPCKDLSGNLLNPPIPEGDIIVKYGVNPEPIKLKVADMILFEGTMAELQALKDESGVVDLGKLEWKDEANQNVAGLASINIKPVNSDIITWI